MFTQNHCILNTYSTKLQWPWKCRRSLCSPHETKSSCMSTPQPFCGHGLAGTSWQAVCHPKIFPNFYTVDLNLTDKHGIFLKHDAAFNKSEPPVTKPCFTNTWETRTRNCATLGEKYFVLQSQSFSTFAQNTALSTSKTSKNLFANCMEIWFIFPNQNHPTLDS